MASSCVVAASGRRQRALTKLSVLGLGGLAAVAAWLHGTFEDFALPTGHGRPVPQQVVHRVEHRARDDMPRQVLELPAEELAEEEAEVYVRPEKRLPYTINFFASRSVSHDTANWKYMEEKLQQALEYAEDTVQSVDVRLTIDESSHKPVLGRHHNLQAQNHVEKQLYLEAAAMAREDAATEDKTAHPLSERRQLAPYRLDVSVKMRHGTVVLSKPKHAQATFLEAVDHVHDTLKRMVRKNKEKRIDRRRHQRTQRRKDALSNVDDERLSDADEMEILRRF